MHMDKQSNMRCKVHVRTLVSGLRINIMFKCPVHPQIYVYPMFDCHTNYKVA